MYKSSWGWTFGYSKHVEYNKIELNNEWKGVQFVGFYYTLGDMFVPPTSIEIYQIIQE